MVTEEQREEFKVILEERRIRPVYQPIVSLEDGSVYGYEALSRIDMPCSFNTEEMFHIAEELNCIWELEELCRKKSLKNVSGKLHHKRLFINVDPNVIHDEKFREGTTCKYLKKYDLMPSDIVFEITERTSIQDADTFRHTINHYKKQQYQIAIDDFGTAYAGIGRICVLEPHFLKIDMSIIRDIDKDVMKRSMVESFVVFCQNVNINLIAEGIETKEELETLIKMKIGYGQGYYLKRPDSQLTSIDTDIRKEITECRLKRAMEQRQQSFWSNVGSICSERETMGLNTPGYEIYEYVKKNPLLSEITVVDESRKVLGVLTRASLMELFGGRYGYSLHAKKTAEELMIRDFMMVDESFSIELVSKMAMVRTREQLYDDVIVTKEDCYYGRVSVKELLETAVTIQVTKAVEANPLTGLPGNIIIEDKVKQCIEEEYEFSIAYLDLDNFKAYNDAYGFNNGDLMIKTVVSCMKAVCTRDEFLGHVGGDDFVIIANHYDLEEECKEITEQFSQAIRGLYSKDDLERGYICSQNRNGFSDTFPMATLSIAVIRNASRQFENIDDFSQVLVRIKKQAKQENGHSIQVF